MNRWATGLVVVLGTAGTVGAQPPAGPPNPYTSRPYVSPYLNLLRRENSPAFNYYTLVRPQLDFQRGLYNAQLQGYANSQALANQQQVDASGLPPTGHGATFMNYGHYFGGRGSGSSPAATSPGSTTRFQGSRPSGRTR
jgi:hypothetical protein